MKNKDFIWYEYSIMDTNFIKYKNMTENIQKKEITYLPPICEIIEVKVEKGFSGSSLIGGSSNESFIETDYSNGNIWE